MPAPTTFNGDPVERDLGHGNLFLKIQLIHFLLCVIDYSDRSYIFF